MVELINLFLFKIYNFQNSKCFKSLVTGFEVDVCVVKYSTHAFSYIFLVCFSNNTFNTYYDDSKCSRLSGYLCTYARNYFCQGGEKTDFMMIVYRKKKYVRTHLGIYSLVSIHSNIKYFIFAFINNKNGKMYKIYIFSYF